MRVPAMRLLAYFERKPMLRIVRLPEGQVEQLPVSLDRGYALDHCLRREGWIAFHPNVEIWGLPLPFGGEPFRIGTEVDWVPGLNPRTVWLVPRREPGEGYRVHEYDGVDRVALRDFDVPGGLYVHAETARGFVVFDESFREPRLLSWSGGLTSDLDPADLPRTRSTTVDADGSPVVGDISFEAIMRGETVHHSEQLELVDPGSDRRIPVDRPAGRDWLRYRSFSPDGRWLAVGVDLSPAVTPEESFARLASLGGRYEKRVSKLVLVETVTGATTLCDGEFDNFNTEPIWTADSQALVFSAPFEKAWWVTRVDDPRLHRIPLRGKPLCDVSDLID